MTPGHVPYLNPSLLSGSLSSGAVGGAAEQTAEFREGTPKGGSLGGNRGEGSLSTPRGSSQKGQPGEGSALGGEEWSVRRSCKVGTDKARGQRGQIEGQ